MAIFLLCGFKTFLHSNWTIAKNWLTKKNCNMWNDQLVLNRLKSKSDSTKLLLYCKFILLYVTFSCVIMSESHNFMWQMLSWNLNWILLSSWAQLIECNFGKEIEKFCLFLIKIPMQIWMFYMMSSYKTAIGHEMLKLVSMCEKFR